MKCVLAITVVLFWGFAAGCADEADEQLVEPFVDVGQDVTAPGDSSSADDAEDNIDVGSLQDSMASQDTETGEDVPKQADVDEVQDSASLDDTAVEPEVEEDVAIAPSPCELNPCPDKKASECKDNVYVTYESGPSCDDSSGKAVCSWKQSSSQDCDDGDLACTQGGCVFPEKVCKGNYLVKTTGDANKVEHCTAVTGNIVINSPFIKNIYWPHLKTIAGALLVENNELLKSVNLEGLISVGGQLKLSNNQALDVFNLSGLTSVGGAIAVSGNEALPNIAPLALKSLGGALTVLNNAGLVDLHMPAVESVSSIAVMGNPVIEGIRLNAASTVAGAAVVRKNPMLKELAFDSLQSVDGILVADTMHCEALDLPQLSSLTGSLVLVGNEVMESVFVPALTTVGDVLLGDNLKLKTFLSGQLKTIEGSLHVRDNLVLETIDFKALENISGALTLSNNEALQTVNVSELSAIGQAVLVYNNAALVSLDFESLNTVGGSMVISGNPELKALDIHQLKSLGLTESWTFSPVSVAGLQYVSGNAVSSHILLSKEYEKTVYDNQWLSLGDMPQMEDKDVTDLVEEDCKLGDTYARVEVFVEDTEYVLQHLEYAKQNDSHGVRMYVTEPAGGWKKGWNVVESTSKDFVYVCNKGKGCNTICDTPWDDMHRTEIYRTGPKSGVKPVMMKFRNFTLTKLGAVGTAAHKKNVAVINNKSLPACLAEAATSSLLQDKFSVAVSGNLQGCTCADGVATCPTPPPTEPGDDPPPDDM